MAIDIKVIPTLHGDEAMRFINNADEVMKSKERVDFSEKIAIARAILKKLECNHWIFIKRMNSCFCFRRNSKKLRILVMT